MVRREALLETIQSLLDPVLDDLGLELVDLEFKPGGRGQVLRIFIDRPGGVTLDDCALLSREFGTILEVEDPIASAYHLEVSSPGIDRPLKKEADFQRFAGERVRIKTLEALDPDGRGHSRKTFRGRLLGSEGGTIRIRQLDKRGGEVALPLADIEQANLDPEF